MVAAANDLKSEVADVAAPGIEANLTGAAGMWSDFNEANREAMMKSELISWPVTLAILVLAFGSLVAAGLPLLLTIVGLIASAGVLYLGTQALADLDLGDELRPDVRPGARHRLRAVHRHALPRRALRPAPRPGPRRSARRWTPPARRCCSPALTVLISLSAVMLVPSPAFRSMSLGIMISVLFVARGDADPAAGGARQARARGSTRLALPWAHSGEHRSPRFARWGELLWRRPLLFGGIALVVLVGLALPILSLKTGMPSIKVVPKNDSSRVGYRQISSAFGAGDAGHAAGDGAAARRRRPPPRRCAPIRGSPPSPGPCRDAKAWS